MLYDATPSSLKWDTERKAWMGQGKAGAGARGRGMAKRIPRIHSSHLFHITQRGMAFVYHSMAVNWLFRYIQILSSVYTPTYEQQVLNSTARNIS